MGFSAPLNPLLGPSTSPVHTVRKRDSADQITVKNVLIYIFDSDLVWWMQLMIIKG